MIKVIGEISNTVENMLGLSDLADRNIYIGDSNIKHMQNSHPSDYKRYGSALSDILLDPDFIGLNKKDSSIEYVKEFQINNEYVKVAVRVSTGNRYFARSMYVLNNKRVLNFINKGTLLPVDKF